jgi:hypothetical protein
MPIIEEHSCYTTSFGSRKALKYTHVLVVHFV